MRMGKTLKTIYANFNSNSRQPDTSNNQSPSPAPFDSPLLAFSPTPAPKWPGAL